MTTIVWKYINKRQFTKQLIHKRTFEANRQPKFSDKRTYLNRSPITSEYQPKYLYYVECWNNEGEVYYSQLCKTKVEALAVVEDARTGPVEQEREAYDLPYIVGNQTKYYKGDYDF